MDKKEKKNGVKQKQTNENLENNEMKNSSEKSTKEEPIKGKLKWSKEDEERSATSGKLDSSGKSEKNTDTAQDQPSNDQELKTNEQPQKDEPSQDEASKEKIDEKEQENSSSSKTEEEKLSKSKKYTIEDTLGPIDFKEYPIDPDEDKSKGQKKAEKEDPIQPDPKVKKEKLADQETKPFVFSKTDEEPKDQKQEKTPQKKPEEKKDAKNKAMTLVKILWLPVTLLVVLLISLVIGHTMIGNQPAGDVFDIEMWIHLYKLIFTK